MADSPVELEDSMENQDRQDKKTKVKSRRPGNTAFRQQRLKAWQPILTPKTVLPLFFAIGIVFAPIGGGLLYASSQVQEVQIDYSSCATLAPSTTATQPIPSNLISWNFKGTGGNIPQASWNKRTIDYTYPNGVTVTNVTQCSLVFDIPSTMNPPVLVYYRLTNFYQNHRRYVKSFDANQLKGNAVDNGTINTGFCDPLRNDPSGKPYYPCGLIANSLFNDTFYSPVLLNVPVGQGDTGNTTGQEYFMTNNSGIAWDTDAALYGKTQYSPSAIAVPPNWVLRYPNGYSDATPPPNLSEDQAFQVWMRTAGLPTFSKLSMRNDTTPMVAGTYRVDINQNFPVEEYGGTKALIISTRTVIGGRNPFLGIAYIVVGGICIVLGVLFTATHLIRPRKLGDHTYLSWNNDQPSTATVTGRDSRPDGGPA